MGSIGSGDGQFNGTLHISSDATGNVYVDNANNKSVQKSWITTTVSLKLVINILYYNEALLT